ncbi:MAG: hypothetical protein K2Q18_03455, partial [Bdellovibrionales bacterium]|nr:hypothetical protein [Bdellovibrionales bacterium]
MLKLFYKTFLIGILSCSLMIMDFNSKGLSFSNLQAETLKTESAEDPDLMATLTMTAIGLLTSRLWTCTKTTDVLVAAGGGAIFIAGEILSTIKLKQVMKDMETQITRDAAGNINNEQIRALERLKETYVEAKKTAGTKKMLQQAAAAAFLAAAVLAYTQETAVVSGNAACAAALDASAATCAAEAAALAATPGGQAAAEAVASGGVAAATAAGEELATEAEAHAIMPSAAAATLESTAVAATLATETASLTCPSTAPAVTLCSNTDVFTLTTRVVCPLPPGIVRQIPGLIGARLYANAFSSSHSKLTAMDVLKSMLIADARADLFSPLGIASSAAIAFLLYTSKTLGLTIDTFLYSPMNRAIIWGVLAATTYLATTATDNVISKIDANISKIDGILNEMKTKLGLGTETDQTKAPSTTKKVTQVPPNRILVGTAKYDSVDLGGGAGGTLPCYTGNDAAKCKAFSDDVKTLPGFANLDAGTQAQILGALKTADGFNGTSSISGASLSSASQLGSSANALRAALDKAKKSAVETLRAKNKKYNFDAETD